MAKGMTINELVEMRNMRTLLVPPRPLTFEEFVDLFSEDDEVELIDGMVVRRMAARTPHEDLFGWLHTLLGLYAEQKNLGVVYGSRTPVQITPHRGRLPDIVFVRKERASIVQEKGIYSAPDLVVEILSPKDTPADIVALEADYQSIGAAEIWIIDQKRKHICVLQKRGERYQEEVISKGVLRSEVVEGFWLKVEWLFAKPLPLKLDTLTQVLGG